jgi:SAM-dependent methyltransferase
VKTRILMEERLESLEVDRELMAHSLSQVSAVNRWLGGDSGLRAGVAPILDGRSGIRILDVGAGDGTTLARLARWARGRGVDVTPVGVDLHPVSCATARGRVGRRDVRSTGGESVAVVRGDGVSLPFGDASFDIVVSSLTLHHFDDEGAVASLREMSRVASMRLVVSDLRRSRMSHVGAQLLSATVWRGNPYTRHDGPVSVLRAFRPEELADLARAAGLRGVGVYSRHPFRLTLVADGGGGTA